MRVSVLVLVVVNGVFLNGCANGDHVRPKVIVRPMSSETASEIAAKLAQMEKDAAGVQAQAPKQ